VNTFAEIVTNRESGIGTVSFQYARYDGSTDRGTGPPSFVLEVNSGGNWIQVGSPISLDGVDVLTSASFNVQEPGPSRIRLRTVSGTDGRRFNIDDIVITPYAAETEDLSVAISNQSGWRLLSSPIATTYAAFLAPVWTQGATGSDAPAGGANVFRYAPATGFVPVTAFSDALQPGQAFAYYHFNDDDYNGVANTVPTLLDVSGDKPAGVVTLNVTSADTARYVLLGNPFSVAMHFDDVVKTDGAMEVVQVWDPSAQRYKARTAGTGDFDGRIAPFQGFWVRVGAGSAGSFRFDRAAITTGSTFYGKERDPAVIIITLCEQMEKVFTECESLRSDQAFITFHPEGDIGEDALDAKKLPSLVADRPLIASMDGAVAHHIQVLPLDLSTPIDIPLRITGVDPSRIRLEMNTDALPAHLSATMSDEFVVRISPVTTSTKDDGRGTMDEFALHPNYPNPFNPSTQIRFTLRSSHVTRLTVFDILGRDIMVLVDGPMSAGSHSVTFDATGLPSGVYLVALEHAGQRVVRRMTLIK